MFTHLYELLRQRAERYPDAVAIGGQHGLVWKTLTSRELLELVDRLAEELAALGVSEGDRVVYWLPNHWRTPVYLFATWKLGAIAVPFDREMNPEAGARILDGVEPRLIIAGYGERPPWARDAEITEWWEPGSRCGVPPARALDRAIRGGRGDRLHLRDDGHAQGRHADPRQSELPGRGGGRPRPARRKLSGGRATSALARARARNDDLRHRGRRGDSLHTEPARSGHPSGAPGAADHPHGRRPPDPDDDGPGTPGAAPGERTGAGLPCDDGHCRPPAVRGEEAPLLAGPSSVGRPPPAP